MWTRRVVVGVWINLVAFPFPAGAVDLVNRDPEAHQVQLLQAGQPRRFIIAGHTTFHQVCTACVVEIDGHSRIEAEDNDRVVIARGQPTIGG